MSEQSMGGTGWSPESEFAVPQRYIVKRTQGEETEYAAADHDGPMWTADLRKAYMGLDKARAEIFAEKCRHPLFPNAWTFAVEPVQEGDK